MLAFLLAAMVKDEAEARLPEGTQVGHWTDVAGRTGCTVVLAPDVAYGQLVGPFVLAGVGMGLFFAPVASVVLGSVARQSAGQASGANNAIRELGGVFGVAVLAAIFSHRGGYGSPQLFTDGITPALWVGAAMVGVGALAALAIPGPRPRAAVEAEPLPLAEAA